MQSRGFKWAIPFVLFLPMVGCLRVPTPTNQQKSQNEAISRSQQRSPYVQRNDIEFNNYNKRQQIADDPTMILWCTSAFSTPGAPLFTVPVVGKVTSGGKRPYSERRRAGDSTYYYLDEVPGPDGMYGHSGEYRYGFTPGGVYSDWYGIETFCTTEPMIWQKERTEIVMGTDPTLLAAQQQAQERLRAGDTEGANRALEQAIMQGRR